MRSPNRQQWSLVLSVVVVVVLVTGLGFYASTDDERARLPVITEIVASSSTTAADAIGDHPDWIELHNPADEPIDLAGWTLSDDDDPTSFWEIPELVLEPGDHVVVFASGRGVPDADGNLHTDFHLDRDGEPVVLTGPDGITIIDRLPPVPVPRNASFGRDPADPDRLCWFAVPTPGEPNAPECFDDETLGAPELSVPAGFHPAPIDLEIVSQLDEAEIFYTLDGSYPDPATNAERTHRYEGPIRIEDRSDEPDVLALIPTTIDRDAVDWSPNLPPELDGPVPKATVVRARTRYGAESSATYFVGDHHVRDALPVVSLAMDAEFLFDHDTGILVPGATFEEYRRSEHFDPHFGPLTAANYHQRGRDWERPFADDLRRVVVMDWCEPSTGCAYQTSVGVRVHGGFTRAYSRKSLRLYARLDYGGRRFDHDLFSGGAPVGHRRLILRNSGNDHVETLLADAYFQGLMGHFEAETQAFQLVVLHLNGEYWGLFNLRERYDRHYLELVHGADPDTVVQLQTHHGILDWGDPADAADYAATIEELWDAPSVTDEVVRIVESRFDLDNFFDYLVAHVFTGNEDWPHNNSRAWRQPPGPEGPGVGPLDGRWRWMVYDLDLFGGGHFAYDESHDPFGDNLAPDLGPELSGGVPALFNRLMEHEPTRNRFVNRLADHLNTAFDEERMLGELAVLEDLFAPEMPTHIARWERPETVEQWHTNVERLGTFMVERVDAQRQQLVGRFELEGTAEITVRHDPAGGTVRVNHLVLGDSPPGVTDPAQWTGVYFDGVPIEIEALAADGSGFSHWEGAPASATVTDPRLTLDPGAVDELEAVFEPLG